MTMKLTALVYSLFIFISCANRTPKTAQETPNPETTQEAKVALIEEAEVLQDSPVIDADKKMEDAVSQTPEIVVANNTERNEEVSPLQKTETEVVKTEMQEEKNATDRTIGVEVADNIPEAEAATEALVEETTSVTPIKEEKSIAEVKEESTMAKIPSHTAWDQLLKRYVDNAGNVDYKSFKNSSAELSAYLDVLAKNKPKSDWSKNEKLAYYINLYNAATVKLILDNYPTKSIKDISRPWGKDIVKIGDDLVSLGHIEHKILRKMNEPRIHFAINCASYSCPKLVNKAFTASGMSAQLEAATKDFVNDTTRNQFSASEAKLSEIFKWYKGDFTDKGSLKDYINNYLSTPMTASTKIKYLKYDWNLNEKR